MWWYKPGSVFGGVGERTREGNGLYMEMKESTVLQHNPFFFRDKLFSLPNNYDILPSNEMKVYKRLEQIWNPLYSCYATAKKPTVSVLFTSK